MEKLTYNELKERLTKCYENGEYDKKGVIVFTEDSFNRQFSLESRSYRVPAFNKVFSPHACGYSLYGSCLDGTDPGVRLEQYIDCEYGKDNKQGADGTGWHIEYCYMEG